MKFGGLTSEAQISSPGENLQVTLMALEKKEPSSPSSLAPSEPRIIVTPKEIVLETPHPIVTAPLKKEVQKPVKQTQSSAADVLLEKPSPPLASLGPKSDQSIGVPQPGLIGPAKQVDIEFEIFSGLEKKSLGLGRHNFKSDGLGNFGLSVKQLIKPDAVELGEEWQLEVSGQINRQGLMPLLFQLQGAVPERLMALKDVSDNAILSPNKIRNGRMPDGILDRQSLLYQFMYQPPVEAGGKLWLTDGVKHVTYTYRVDGFESLTIDSIGKLRTMKLIISSTESTEIIELWIIPDLRYLPAKMRHTDAQGVVTEQLVVSLSTK